MQAEMKLCGSLYRSLAAINIKQTYLGPEILTAVKMSLIIWVVMQCNLQTFSGEGMRYACPKHS
jgi:hypothetical protein